MRPLLLLLPLIATGCVTAPSLPSFVTGLVRAPAAAAIAKIDPATLPLPLWSRVRTGTLKNGLRYFVLPHHASEKRALLWLAVDAGSILEDDDQRGLAHFCEHMAFNGTTHFPKQAIVSYLESIGMRFGADLNAYTSFDETVYQLEVPTDRSGALDKGLEIIRDWAGNVSFDPREVESERGVVREEWRLGRGAQQRILDKQSKALFTGSRYADRLAIGDLATLERAPRAALQRFYRDWYRPELMAVIVVGDVDPAAIEAEITRRFSDLTNPLSPRPRLAGGTPRADGTRVSIVTDREATGATVLLSHAIPKRSRDSLRDYRRDMVQDLYQNLLNERLEAISRRADAPFVLAAAQVKPQTRSFDSFLLVAQAKQGQVDVAMRGLLTEVLRVQRHGFSQSELLRAKAEQMRNISDAATKRSESNAIFAAEIVRHAFEGEAMPGRLGELEIMKSFVPRIALAELNDVAAQFGGAANRVVLISGPEGEPLPKPAAVLASIEDLTRQDVVAWVDEASNAALMTTLPTPGKIVGERSLPSIGVTEWTLANGVRVIAKPTDFSADFVGVRGMSPGGQATVGDADAITARFATKLLDLGGLGPFDQATMQKLAKGQRARSAVSIDATTETVDATGATAELETVLQLVHLRMTAPRLDRQAIAVGTAQYNELLGSAENSPEYQFATQLERALWRDDPRHRMIGAHDLDRVDAARALAIYNDRFGDAGDFVFVVIGAFELETLRPLVEQYLGSLPATTRKELEVDRKARKAPGVVSRTWKIGQEPKAMVRLEFHGDQAWSRDAERDLTDLSEVLAIRLRELLREDKGGVYGVEVNGTLERAPHGERSLVIAFGCDPARVDELIGVVRTEIASLQRRGVAPEYVEKAKQLALRTRERGLRTNEFWAKWLLRAYRFGDDPTVGLDAAERTARVTSDHLRAAAQRYLDGTQVFQAVLLPK